MPPSTNRILTTHTGSLPRPDDLADLLWRREQEGDVDEVALTDRVRQAVAGVVRQQVTVGLDVVNDGEMGKLSYSTYVRDRLSGFAPSPEARSPRASDLTDFPAYRARLSQAGASRRLTRVACVGPIAYQGRSALERDLANLTAAVAGAAPRGVFLTAASPGVIALFHPNRHYPSHEAYLSALAEAMREEYEAIHRAGFLLQVDCPDLAAGFHMNADQVRLDDFRRVVALNIAVLNHATAAIPPERMRLHLCWGNYEGPHHHDLPLREIVDVVLTARPAGLSVEAANPRHGHEWRVWEDVPLPDDKVLIPGVVDSTTNFIEHPELVAERIVRFARVAGRERVVAGTDCGFATVAGTARVDPAIAWAKLGSLVEGARLASAALWTGTD
jgi:5-methyltetrahydropteroyltriglutamate--homocysteine methyltransferase